MTLSTDPNEEEGIGAFRALIDDVRADVEARLDAWLEPRVAAALAVSADVGAAARIVAESTRRGGKRVRPALVACAFEGHGGAPRGRCAPAMLAVELLQTYFLIHDDWMDDDDLRRGGPAVHVIFRERMSSRARGDAMAILAGDLAAGYAQEALLASDLPLSHTARAARAFARMQVEVVTGQIAEFCAVAGEAVPVETIHALKTASYTVTGPLLLGATLAGADDARCAELERFGRPLGIAFQLRDDLLGVFGDPAVTGKPVAKDLAEGKQTLLVAEGLKDPRAADALRRVLGDRAARAEDLAAAVALLEASGARRRVEERVATLCGEARAALDVLAPGITPRAQRELAGAITALGGTVVVTTRTGRAGGKVILFGEHAVVYGVPAIAVGIERGAFASATPLASGPSTLRSPTWNITVREDEPDVPLARALRDVLEATRAGGVEIGPVAVEVTADLPPGGGLGCSAALGVAIARALDPEAAPEVIADRAGAWERTFHGNPSGVDAAVSALGGCVLFKRGAPGAVATIERIRTSGTLHLCVGNTGHPASTRLMVEGLAQLCGRRPDTTRMAFDAIDSVVRSARLAIEAGDRVAVGQLLDRNQDLLAELFLSTPAIEEMCAAARGAGALGAKLTGGGGGGCVIALADGPEVGARILSAWEGAGFDGFLTTVGAEVPRRSVAPKLEAEAE